MKVGGVKHSLALHCTAYRYIIILQNGKYNAEILFLYVKQIAL